MPDNEIINECPFKEQIENYKEEIKEFFSRYENKSGCEDRIEVCLIRAGYRTVLKAEEEITHLQAENIALNRRAMPSSGHILKVGNALLFAENKEDYDITINAIKAEAYKEFLPLLENFRNEVVEKFIIMCDGNDYNKLNLMSMVDTIDCIYDKHIDNLLKELVGEDK